MPVTRSTSVTLVGRATERAELSSALESGRPELIAVYGRRRVGKTYLIRSFFAEQLCFELTGERDASSVRQLTSFAAALSARTGLSHSPPRDWSSAFRELTRYLAGELRRGQRKVVFLDELPWLAGRRSGFLPAFEQFWNAWASRQDGLVIVICGSAASWMIAKVLNQRGGLHNRVTRSLRLLPFNLRETEEFLRIRGVALERKQVLEVAMAVGGIPYYLDYVRKGRSAPQAIDTLFFSPNAPLRDEFQKLFAALFENHERHIKVIRALAAKSSGLSRQELARASRMPSGGNLTTVLDELEESGFVSRVVPFGRTARDTRYRLIDELTLFHLRWIDGKRRPDDGAGYWLRLRTSAAWRAWSGYAFEALCLKHVAQIKSALGIAGVQTESSAWVHRASAHTSAGAQIDLLIDRRDDVINVCELKFADNAFVIDKKYAEELRRKLEVFKRATGTRKTLFLTLIATHGVKANQYSTELVQASLTQDALFN
jgi:predicted AAA+ superfamily ATPase